MLVLTRRVGEKIVIDGNTIITVNQLSNNRVRLGIEAPDTVRVLRWELIAAQAEPNATSAVDCPPA
jgi:carbon storage regulator